MLILILIHILIMMLRIMFKIMLRAVDARGWSCESYSQRVALLELLEARKAMGF